jgi:hypothetical protein
MKHFFIFCLICPFVSFGQASVAYYPFNGLFSVSSNPNKLVWLDGRIQTNTIFQSLSTTLCPLVNVKQTPRTNYYVGPGVRFNALNGLNDAKILEGYSLHVGVRVAPLAAQPNLRVAFELSPSAAANFKSGVFYSYLGVVWQFQKKTP